MIKRKHRTNPLPIIIFLTIMSLALFELYNNFYNEDIKSNNTNITSNKDNTNNDEKNSAINVDEKFIKAYVKRVVDGDTIIVTIDDNEYRLRLIGVNSPEYTSKVEVYGKEATEYTTSMLTGNIVYLEKDVSETDKYKRLLRYVWLEIPNRFSEDEIKRKMFNAILVINGYAQAATYPPDVKYANYFKTFTDIARKNNVGLWKTK